MQLTVIASLQVKPHGLKGKFRPIAWEPLLPERSPWGFLTVSLSPAGLALSYRGNRAIKAIVIIDQCGCVRQLTGQGNSAADGNKTRMEDNHVNQRAREREREKESNEMFVLVTDWW